MAATKQILIRVTEEKYWSLAETAKSAGVSVPSLVRDGLHRLTTAENRHHRRFEQLLLARINSRLRGIADGYQTSEDRMATIDVLECLIGIERELRNWKEKTEP